MVFPRAVEVPQAGFGADWLEPAGTPVGQSASADPLQSEAARAAQRRHRLNSSKRIPQPPHLEAQLPHQCIEPRQRVWQYCDSLLVCDSEDHSCSLDFHFLASVRQSRCPRIRAAPSPQGSRLTYLRQSIGRRIPEPGFRSYTSLSPEHLESRVSTKSTHRHHIVGLFA